MTALSATIPTMLPEPWCLTDSRAVAEALKSRGHHDATSVDAILDGIVLCAQHLSALPPRTPDEEDETLFSAATFWSLRQEIPRFSEFREDTVRAWLRALPGLKFRESQLPVLVTEWVRSALSGHIVVSIVWLRRNTKLDGTHTRRLLDLATAFWDKVPPDAAKTLIVTASSLSGDAGIPLLEAIAKSKTHKDSGVPAGARQSLRLLRRRKPP